MNNKFILDACCGAKHFWFNKNHPNALYIDKRQESKGCCKQRPNFCVQPDIKMDFRQLSFATKTFKLIVFDPPHLLHLGSTSVLKIKYGRLTHNWTTDLTQGFKECWRVLSDYGVLVFKWNDRDIPIKQVLALFNQVPLFGSKGTNKKGSKTAWFIFMKIP
jgi:SAM-dependent methyltransferase